MQDHATGSGSVSDLDPLVLDRVLAGTGSPSDDAAVAQWATANPAEAGAVERLRQGLSAQRAEPFLTGTAAVKRVADALEGQRHSKNGTAQRPSDRAISTPSYRNAAAMVRYIGAAALTVLVAIGVFTRRHRSDAGSATAIAFQTPIARAKSITLPDSTKIHLAPQSTLTIDSAFGRHTRTVRLTGEAQFDVSVSSGAPFIVQSGNASTRVLGTSFDVRHYDADPGVRVSVESGRVMAKATGSAVVVAAGRAVHLQDSTITELRLDELHSYTDWKRGQLIFREVAIPEMLRTVGRWYGYEFKLADSTLAAKHVSGTFRLNDSTEMFTVLRGVLDVSMTFDGKIVTLHPRTSPNRAPVRTRILSSPFKEVGR